MQPVLTRNVPHHGERLFEMRPRTRRAGSADQQRDIELSALSSGMPEANSARCSSLTWRGHGGWVDFGYQCRHHHNLRTHPEAERTRVIGQCARRGGHR
jgi:hypothetical protein